MCTPYVACTTFRMIANVRQVYSLRSRRHGDQSCGCWRLWDRQGLFMTCGCLTLPTTFAEQPKTLGTGTISHCDVVTVACCSSAPVIGCPGR